MLVMLLLLLMEMLSVLMLIGMIPLSYCAACAGKPCDGNAWNAAFSAATSNALGTYAGNKT